MQPQKVKFAFVEINMKRVSYMSICLNFKSLLKEFQNSCNLSKLTSECSANGLNALQLHCTECITATIKKKMYLQIFNDYSVCQNAYCSVFND